MKDSYTGILSLSDRAIAAKADGKLTYSQLSAWQKRAVKAEAAWPCEWHHTSGAANRTDFYDLGEFEKLNPANFPAIKAEKAIQADPARLRITISYDKMTGGFSRHARKKFETITVTGLDIRKADNRITGAKGRRLDSKNTSVMLEHLPPKCRNWRAISKQQAEAIGYKFA
jgi:hypothetical protein